MRCKISPAEGHIGPRCVHVWAFTPSACRKTTSLKPSTFATPGGPPVHRPSSRIPLLFSKTAVSRVCVTRIRARRNASKVSTLEPSHVSEPLREYSSEGLDNLASQPSQPSPPQSQSSSSSSSSWLQGNLYLLSVAVLWGSYTPVLKILFNLPGGPTPELVAWIRGVLQLVILASVVLVSQQSAKAAGIEQPKRHRTEVLGTSVPTILLGALEIGFYNSCATLLQTEGISMSGAIRASFLIQATALWTPMLSTLFGDRPNKWQWTGSVLALFSACIVTLDQQQAVEISGFPDTGDLFILAATVVYSMATVRIPSYAKNISPLELAAGKSSALAVVASILLLFEFSPLDPHPVGHLVDLWPAYQDQVSAWGGLLWAGVFCGALTAFLHVKGQSMVTATEAQLVFSTVPLWSAVIAALTLPNEHLGPLTCLGAALMVVAGLVSTKK